MESIVCIDVIDGFVQISCELGKCCVVVGVNVCDCDLGGFVVELQVVVVQKVKLFEGYYLEWGGQFQNMECVMGYLKVIVLIMVVVIFFLLFLFFNLVCYVMLIILVLLFVLVGGIIGLFVMGEYLFVLVLVGFVVLWGIVVFNGVVLVSMICSLCEQGMLVEELVWLGLCMCFWFVMMMVMVVMLGLILFLFVMGLGLEV